MRKTLAVLLFALFVIFVFAGCSGKNCSNCPTPKTPTEPTVCTVSVQASSDQFACEGSSVVITMTTQSGCALPTATASVNQVWASYHIDSNSSVTITAVANNTGVSRPVVATVNGQSFTFTQPACSTSPLMVTICLVADADASALAVCPTGVVTGTGHGHAEACIVVLATDEATAKAAKLAELQATAVAQAKATAVCISTPPVTPTCSFLLSRTSESFSCSGGSGLVSVTVPTGCSWFAKSNVDWIIITAGGSWTNGSGSASYTVVANNTARVGTFIVAGQTFTVSQDACPVILPPTPQTCQTSGADNVGGSLPCRFSDTVTVNVPVTGYFTCPDGSVKSDIVNVTGNGSGTSTSSKTDATVKANAAAQADAQTKVAAARTQAENNAKAKCPVVQPCTFSLVQTVSLPAVGGNRGLSVDASRPDCTWSASTTTSWITITSFTGVGTGDVQYVVQPNSGSPRTGTMTVAGKIVTVNQEGVTTPSCTYVVVQTVSLPAEGGNRGISVSASSSTCSWTAVSHVFWIQITSSATGTGSGDVQYTVAGNGGPARTGTMTIAGKTVTVTQSAP